MTVSIPLLAIMAIAVYVVYRYMGLKEAYSRAGSVM